MLIGDAREEVRKLLGRDNSGHGLKHTNRVLDLSLKFAEAENAAEDVIALTALLHDVDDYKLFGIESANNLTNARKILAQCLVIDNTKEQVLNALSTIGYSKRLKGIKPTTLEAMIVSDADMCDGIGANGILRSYQYNLSHGNLFFEKSVLPTLDMSADEYMTKRNETSVTHMFEKMLKLKGLMLTNAGKKEAIERHSIVVDFLYHFLKKRMLQNGLFI